MTEERPEKGFKVEDKRRFDAKGEPRAEPSEDAPAAPSEAAERGRAKDGARASERSRAPRPDEITFSSFVVGLATQALALLGAVADPAIGSAPKNLPEAAAMIDILRMLAAKTTGNLAEDEHRLLEDIIYDLQMRYVAEIRGAKNAPGEAE